MARPPTDPPGSPGYRAITRSENGVTVTKTANLDEFPVPAIAFEIRSERRTRATVRVLDVVPEEVPLEDVGFHADHGIECWEVVGDAVVFERDIDPGEAYHTVYGVRSADDGSIERLLTDPEIDVTDAEESVESERSVAEHVPTSEHVPTTERDRAAEGDAAPERDAAAGRTRTGGGALIDDETVPAAATASDVAAALARQLRGGNVDDEDVDTLRDALGERITRLERGDSDADTGTETAERERDRGHDRHQRAERSERSDTAVEHSIYRLVTNDPPTDLSVAEIEGELRDIGALSGAERREYGNRGLDIDEREHELTEAFAGQSTDTKRP